MKRSSSLLHRTRRGRWIRTSIQASLFLGALILPVGIFHTICPMGGIATLTRLVSQGLYIPKTGIANIILLMAVLTSTIVAGPVFCGWLCPLGTVQEWTNALARKVKVPQVRVAHSVDRFLKILRYLVLTLILYATAKSFNLAFIKADPYYALMHFYTGEVAPLALIILCATLISSLFIQRPWCRWLCPLGAVLSFVGKFSIIKVRRPSEGCIWCGACSKACPVGLDPSAEERVVSSTCIRCGLCETACPPKLRTTRHAYTLSLCIALLLMTLFFLAPHLGRAGDGNAQQTTVSMQTTVDELPTITGRPMAEILALLELPEGYDSSTRLVDIEDDFEQKSWLWIEDKLKASEQNPE